MSGHIIAAEMQCDYCEKKATVHYTQIIDGASKKASLCETCAAEQGITDPESFLLDQMPPSSPNTPEEGSPKNPSAEGSDENSGEKKPSFLSPNIPKVNLGVTKSGQCPGCGFTYENLNKTGRLGCSECYQFFRKEIKASLDNMHKGVTHQGRVPEGVIEDIELREQTKKLENALADAIESEDFETAAKLRDELNALTPHPCQ